MYSPFSKSVWLDQILLHVYQGTRSHSQARKPVIILGFINYRANKKDVYLILVKHL